MKKRKYNANGMIYRIIFIILILSTFYGSKDNMIFYVGITIMGVYTTFNGIIEFLSRKRSISNSTQIEGIVVDSIREVTRGRVITYHPVIEYVDKLDLTIKQHTSRNGYFRFMFKEGQRIKIRKCNGRINEEIFIDIWFDIWGFSFFSVLIGCCMIAVGFMKLIY